MKILVFFQSPTCGHSRRMDSIVDHFLRQHRSEVRLAKVDVRERPDLARRFRVNVTPTVLLLEDLVEVERMEGRRTLPALTAAMEPHMKHVAVASELEGADDEHLASA